MASLHPIPSWPYYECDGECHTVRGEIDKLPGLTVTSVILFLVFLACLVFASSPDESVAEMSSYGVLLVPAYILGRFVSNQIIPPETIVHFTKDYITINGTQFDLSPQYGIAFRASESVLTKRREVELRANGKQSESYLHKMIEFQKVEMIYGFNPVLIAQVSGEARAAQFAAVLQYAYSQSQLVSNNRKPTPLA